MKLVIGLSVAVSALFLFFGCGNDPVNSAKSEPQVNYEAIAQTIVDGKMSDAELEAKNFSDEELVLLIKEVGFINGISKDETQKILDSCKIENQKSKSLPKVAYTGCSQNVELLSGTKGTAYAYGYFKDLGCDNDPSDEDWTLQFGNQGVSVDPSKVKWWGSWYVRTVFSQTYGGNLLACDLCSYPRTICLGTNGVALAGGINYVKNNLYIWNQ